MADRAVQNLRFFSIKVFCLQRTKKSDLIALKKIKTTLNIDFHKNHLETGPSVQPQTTQTTSLHPQASFLPIKSQIRTIIFENFY
jgi:hypothetical protein